MFTDSDDGSFFDDESDDGSITSEKSILDNCDSNQNEETSKELTKPLLSKHLLQLKSRLGGCQTVVLLVKGILILHFFKQVLMSSNINLKQIKRV